MCTREVVRQVGGRKFFFFARWRASTVELLRVGCVCSPAHSSVVHVVSHCSHATVSPDSESKRHPPHLLSHRLFFVSIVVLVCSFCLHRHVAHGRAHVNPFCLSMRVYVLLSASPSGPQSRAVSALTSPDALDSPTFPHRLKASSRTEKCFL